MPSAVRSEKGGHGGAQGGAASCSVLSCSLHLSLRQWLHLSLRQWLRLSLRQWLRLSLRRLLRGCPGGGRGAHDDARKGFKVHMPFALVVECEQRPLDGLRGAVGGGAVVGGAVGGGAVTMAGPVTIGKCRAHGGDPTRGDGRRHRAAVPSGIEKGEGRARLGVRLEPRALIL